MFDYLDVVTCILIRKISAKDLYTLSLEESDKSFPELKPWANDDRFWADLCQFHFHRRPFDSATAKNFFQGEYLFSCKRYSEAQEKKNCRALHFGVRQCIAEKKYDRAIEYANRITTEYGMVGKFILLEIYQAALSDSTLKKPTQIAETGLAIIVSLQNEILTPLSEFYFVNFGWQKTINDRYESVEKFIVMGTKFFEDFLELPINLLKVS